MRLLTANLFTGRASLHSFGALLDSENPDMVICQEVGSEMATLLKSRFEYGSVNGDDRDFGGRAMVSKVAIEALDVPMPHRHGLRTLISLGGLTVQMVGVHLANPIQGREAMRQRGGQVETILNVAELHDGPSVVVGDLNATPLWPAYRRLRTRFRDGVRDSSGMFPSRTWSPVVGWPSVLRIDHILTDGVALIDVSAHRIEGADHRALTATLIPLPD